MSNERPKLDHDAIGFSGFADRHILKESEPATETPPATGFPADKVEGENGEA
jgi:hypothetical protein